MECASLRSRQQNLVFYALKFPDENAIAANLGATTLTIKIDVGEDKGRGFARLGSGNPNNI